MLNADEPTSSLVGVHYYQQLQGDNNALLRLSIASVRQYVCELDIVHACCYAQLIVFLRL